MDENQVKRWLLTIESCSQELNSSAPPLTIHLVRATGNWASHKAGNMKPGTFWRTQSIYCVTRTCNPSIWGAEAGRLRIWGQIGPHREIMAQQEKKRNLFIYTKECHTNQKGLMTTSIWHYGTVIRTHDVSRVQSKEKHRGSPCLSWSDFRISHSGVKEIHVPY